MDDYSKHTEYKDRFKFTSLQKRVKKANYN